MEDNQASLLLREQLKGLAPCIESWIENSPLYKILKAARARIGVGLGNQSTCADVVAFPARDSVVLGVQSNQQKPASISCISKIDALWFCYSPVYQMTEYYREGTFNNCRSKWGELFDCISLKTKPANQIQAILEERERAKPHIWEFRTQEEAAKHWKEEFGHLQD